LRPQPLITAALLVGAAVSLLFFVAPPAGSEADDSRCLLCHGTPRTLIGAVREMAREGKGERKISTETVGEG